MHELGWHAARWMGQAAVDVADRDELLALIRSAEARVEPLDDLVALSAEPGRLEALLGAAEARRFLNLSNASAPLYGSVRAVRERLEQPEQADWVVTDQQRRDVDQWAANVGEMYSIYLASLRRPPVPSPVPAPMPAPVPVQQPPAPVAGTGLETALWAGAAGVGLVALIALLRRG